MVPQSDIFSSEASPAVSQGRPPRPEAAVFQVALGLLQLVRPEALVDARRQFVAQRRDDVAVAVKADPLAHLEAGEKKTEVGDDL